MRPRLLTGLLFLFTCSAYGQTSAVDSLLEAFIVSKDSDKELQTIVFEKINEISFEQAEQLVLSKLKGVDQISFEAAVLNRVRGHIHAESKGKAEGIPIVRHALEIAKTAKVDREIGQCNLDLGYYYRDLGFYLFSAEYLVEAGRIFSKLNDIKKTSRSFYEAALTSYKAGNIKQSIAEQKKAVKFYNKVEPGKLLGEDQFYLMSGYNTMGLAYKRLNDYDSALFCLKKADSLARVTERQFWIKLVGGNVGEVYLLMNQVDKAMPLFKADYKEMLQQGDYDLIASATLNIVDAHLHLNQLDSAIILLKGIKERSINGKELRYRYWMTWSSTYDLNRDYKGALYALQMVITLQDSARLSSEAFNVLNLKAIYEVESKNESIRKLSSDNALQQARIQRQTIFIFSGGAIVILLVVLVGMFYRFNRKNKSQVEIIREQKDEIEEKNAELEMQSESLLGINKQMEGLNTSLEEHVKDRTRELEVALNELNNYLYRSSHDLRRPLTTLMGLTMLYKEGNIDQDEIVNMMEKTAYMLDGMLRKMQMAHDLDYTKPHQEQVNVVELIYKIREQLLSDAENRMIQLQLDTENHSQAMILASRRFVEIVLYNIIENAVVFTVESNGVHPSAMVRVQQLPDSVMITVSDNGIGFDREIAEKIFQQFYRGSEKSRGSGLGLFLVKKTLEKLAGTIKIQSEPLKGTSVIITLPKVFSGQP